MKEVKADKNMHSLETKTKCFSRKRGFRIIFLFLCLFAAQGFFLPAAAKAQQVKAVWVRPFINAQPETRKDPLKGREFIRRELERIRRAGLNTVYLETFWSGYAIYPSRHAAQRPVSIPFGVAQKNDAGQSTGWDVLQTYLEEAEKQNLKIHAWLHVFHQWHTNLGGVEKSPIFSRHPDWAVLDRNGSPLIKTEAEGPNRDIYKVFLSPSNPQARKFLGRIVGEIADNYPQLGGIQWDYIRYPLQSPETDFDYNPLALAAFRKETDLDARKLSAKNTPGQWRIWQDWKTRQVTEVVRQLGRIVRRKRPRWEISAAVFPDLQENVRVKQQDWKDWARRGYVDALLPMLYSPDFAQVESWAEDFRKEMKGAKTRLYPALFIGHFYNPQTKSFTPDYLDLEKKLSFDGFGLFAAQSLTDDLIEKLAKRN